MAATIRIIFYGAKPLPPREGFLSLAGPTGQICSHCGLELTALDPPPLSPLKNF